LLGGESWKVGVVNLALLARLLRTTTEKGHLFGGKSATPASEKTPATPVSKRQQHQELNPSTYVGRTNKLTSYST